LLLHIFTLYIHTRLQYYVEHNENITYRQAGEEGTEGRVGSPLDRAEEVEGGEENSGSYLSAIFWGPI